MRIHLLGKLERIAVRQISIGWRDREDEARLAANELEYHALDLLFDVNRLVADGHLGQTGQVDQGQVEYCNKYKWSSIEDCRV